MAWAKTSRQSRGYGATWDRTRKRIMARDFGICQVCKMAIAVAVDHRTPKARGGTDDDSNLQAICEACHTAKTAADSGRKLLAHPAIGADGWPIK